MKEDLHRTYHVLRDLLELDTPQGERTYANFNIVCDALFKSAAGDSPSQQTLSRDDLKRFMETLRKDLGMHTDAGDQAAMDEVY